MKKIGMLLATILSLVLCGCTVVGSDTEMQTGEDTAGVAAYRLMISELEQELSALRAEQESEAFAYEKRIRELESQLAVLKDSESEKAPSTEASPFSFELLQDRAVLVSYQGNERKVTVPQTYGGKPVKEIREGAFQGSAVEEVILPNGIETIGWFAFSGCYRLRAVTLPASVVSIGYGAFDYCSVSMRFYCPSGSYAATYAESYGIPVSKFEG